MILFLFALIVLIVYLYSIFTRRIRVPDGLREIPIERGLPIIGILHEIEPPLAFYLGKLGRKHGPIFRIKLGTREILVLNDHSSLKKTYFDSGINFSGRPLNKINKLLAHNSGIMFIDGEQWATQRSFIVRVLRDFGLGRSRSVEIVQSECQYLLDELELFSGQRADFAKLLPIYIANVISLFLMNKRLARDDRRMTAIETVLAELTKQMDIFSLIWIMFPVFDYSEWLARLVTFRSNRVRMIREVDSLFRDEIEEHRSRLDLNSEGEDLIDRFLIQQHQVREQTGSVGSFTDWQLIRSAFELFGSGYETISCAIGWSMTFMARYPDIQRRVYGEIVDSIGTERLPTINDKRSLNYTQAVMDEILRLGSAAPIGIFRRVLEDTSVDGYFIPRNTITISNILACHTDPNVWERPLEFYPEHFLALDENGDQKYTPREELIPFGMGKRQCLGESLARAEFLIFYLSIVQRFQVSFADEITDEMYKRTLIGNEGFIRFSNIKDFIFKRRS